MADLIRPEDWWPVDPAWRDGYDAAVAGGTKMAAEFDACIVMLCRNSMPWLTNTCGLLKELSGKFRSCRQYWFENDSDDATWECMERQRDLIGSVEIEHETLGGADARGFSAERTQRLAYCRNKCLDWVRRNAADTAWTIVLDSDPHGGFSVDGVMNSIRWLGEFESRSARPLMAGGMASYGVMRAERTYGPGHGIGLHRLYQYDGWAARLNDWRDRRDEVGFSWFFTHLPAVGSPPIPYLSAFGGLAVYRTPAFLAGGYAGGDCEHVGHHQRIMQAGYGMWINPGCRYVAF